MDLSTIVYAPVITEKSIADAQIGKFTFKVIPTANKNAIKQAVEKKFQVHVTKVMTQLKKGKKRRFGPKREEVTLGMWKKATVKLKKGETIGLFDLGEKK